MNKIMTFENIKLDVLNPEVKINDYFSFKLEKGKTNLYWEENKKDIYFSNPTTLIDALKIALPEIHIYPVVLDNSIFDITSSYIINYFNMDDKTDIVKENKILLNGKEDKILDVYNMIVELDKNNERCPDGIFGFWNVAINKYWNAYNPGSFETGIQLLITCLEGLLVNSTSEVSYKTSLYTALVHGDDSRSRKEIYEFIREMYNIRSKVVHGDIESIKGKLKKRKLSSDYIRLKVIVSDVLIKTFGKNRNDVGKKICDHIFTCGIFDL